MSVTPATPSSPPPGRPRPPSNIWTHLADIFDRCLDNDERAQRLHGFTDPLARVVLVFAAAVSIMLLLVALAAIVLLVVGLAVPTAPAWMPAAGAGGVGGSVVIGVLLRRGLRAAGRRLSARTRQS